MAAPTVKELPVVEDETLDENETPEVVPFILHFGEDYEEDNSHVGKIYMTKTANPEATMTGKKRDDTNG